MLGHIFNPPTLRNAISLPHRDALTVLMPKGINFRRYGISNVINFILLSGWNREGSRWNNVIPLPPYYCTPPTHHQHHIYLPLKKPPPHTFIIYTHTYMYIRTHPIQYHVHFSLSARVSCAVTASV